MVRTFRKLPAWVLPRSEQNSFPDIFIIDILEDTILARNGRCYTRQQRGKHSIDIIEIKYKYDLEINDIVPEALAQHEELNQSLLAYGWHAVRVHAFIIGSAGTISKSLHTILTTCGLARSETRQRLLNSIAYHSVVRTARIVRLGTNHIVPPEASTTTDTIRMRSAPREDPPSSSWTSAPDSRPVEDALLPSNITDTCSLPLPPLQPSSHIEQSSTPNEETEYAIEPNNQHLLRRSTRKRKLSRHMQEIQDRYASGAAVQPTTIATHFSPQTDGAGSQHERGCRHTPQTTSTRKRKPVTTLQTLPKRAYTRLQANTRTDECPPNTPLTLCNDAQQRQLLSASNNNPPKDSQPHVSSCLSNQDSIALSRTRRCAQRPQHLCDSPARGRSRARSQDRTSNEAPRPKRTRRASSRTSPSSQPKKIHRSRQSIPQDASNSHEDTVLLSAPILSTAQQSGLPFDRGKT